MRYCPKIGQLSVNCPCCCGEFPSRRRSRSYLLWQLKSGRQVRSLPLLGRLSARRFVSECPVIQDLSPWRTVVAKLRSAIEDPDGLIDSRLDRKLPVHSVTAAIKTLAESGGRSGPREPRKVPPSFLPIQTAGTAVSTKLTARFPAELRQDRSDQGSSPCSTPPRSPSQTPPSSRHMHRLPRLPGAGSSNRRPGRHGYRST